MREHGAGKSRRKGMKEVMGKFEELSKVVIKKEKKKVEKKKIKVLDLAEEGNGQSSKLIEKQNKVETNLKENGEKSSIKGIRSFFDSSNK